MSSEEIMMRSWQEGHRGLTSNIDITNIEVTGWEAAIRGMRNSRQSWNLMDTVIEPGHVCVGPIDMQLMSKLAKLGGSHAKFRRMIHVQMDINAPFYWWKQFDTYKVGTVSNSTSTMYSVAQKPFETDDFAIDNVMSPTFGMAMVKVLSTLNQLRDIYNDKEIASSYRYGAWREMIKLLPESYKQLRTVDLNYEVIAKIVKERDHHKLVEWNEFIKTMHTLPYAEELIFVKGEKNDSNKCQPAEDDKADA